MKWMLSVLTVIWPFLLPSGLLAQSCGWSSSATIVNGLNSLDLLLPSGPNCSTPNGLELKTYFVDYFISGCANCKYEFNVEAVTTKPLSGPVSPMGSAWVYVRRYSPAIEDYDWVLSWNVYTPTEGTTECAMQQQVYPLSGFEVQGGDIVRLQYTPNALAGNNHPRVSLRNVSLKTGFPVTEPSSAVELQLPSLPADGVTASWLLLTHPENFVKPAWRFVGPSRGCDLGTTWKDPLDGYVWYLLRPGTEAGDITVECYEGITFGVVPSGYPGAATLSANCKVQKTFTIRPKPEIHFNGPAYVGGNIQRRVQATITEETQVFNDVVWSIEPASSLGCSINPQSGEITLGNEQGTISVVAKDINSVGESAEWCNFTATLQIKPAPQIELDYELAPQRTAQAYVSDYYAFHSPTAQHPQSPVWTISSRVGAGDCSVSQDGLITVGQQTGSITLKARDPIDGYYILRTVTIYGAPQLTLAPPAGGIGNCGVLTATKLPMLLIVSLPDVFTEPEVEIVQQAPMNSRWDETSGWIWPGNYSGPITVVVQDTDGYSVQAEFYVRQTPVVSSIIPPPPLRAWGSQATASASGDFLGGKTWIISYPRNYYGYPSLPYPAPLPTINPQTGVITSGNLPCLVDIFVRDSQCGPGDYEAEATVAILAIPPPPPPGPQTSVTPSTVPAGGTVKPQATVIHPELMNGYTFETLDPQFGYINPTTGLITPGNSSGQMRIRAKDIIYPTYFTTEATLNIVQGYVTFNRTVLIANNTAQATAFADPAVFPTATWSIPSGGGSALANVHPTTGLITPYSTPGWITVRATATSGPNNGTTADGQIEIREVPTISFDKPYLIANPSVSTKASVSDSVVFPSVTWSISGNGDPGASGTLPTVSPAGDVTAGTRTGTYTVQAQSPAPDNFVITKTIEVRANTPIQFSASFLLADGNSTATAILFSGTYPNVIWSLATSPGNPLPTGTTIEPLSGESSTGLIRAGITPGIIKVVAVDGTTGGTIAESDFRIRTKLEMRFDVAKLQADGKSKCWATVSPGLQMSGPPVWTIEGSDLQCKIESSGRITAGMTKGRIVVRAEDPVVSGYYAEGTLELTSKCDDDCEAGDCIGGGGFANNNSVDVSISLGYAEYGEKAVYLRIKESTASDNITSPSGLFLSQTSADVITHPPVITPATPISQVKTPAMLAVVTAEVPGLYTIKLYHNSQVVNPSGPSPFSLVAGATPFSTWTISSPMPNNYRVIESRGVDHVADYRFLNPGWELVKDGGKRKERRVRIGNTETYTIMDAANGDQIKYKEVSNYTSYLWGDELTSQTVGTGASPLTTEWFYETSTFSTAYKRLVRMKLPNGSWEIYRYSGGRLSRIISQVGDNPVPIDVLQEQQNRVKRINYSNALGQEETIVKVKDIEVSHIYRIRTRSGDYDLLREIRCQNRGVTSTSASGNLVTETYSYPKDHDLAYLPKRVLNADGTIRVYSYSPPGDTRTTTIREGAPNINKDEVVDGVQTVRVIDKAGNLLSEQITTIGGGVSLVLASKTGTVPDPFGRRSVIAYQDNTSESVSYGTCCGVENTTDREGVPTTYQYDDAKRIWVVEKAGIGSVTTYDVAGRRTTQSRRWQENGVTQTKLLQSFNYDDAGRLTDSTDLVGATTHSYSVSVADGHRITTTTYPDGSTKIESFAQDGNILEISGSGVSPVKYFYDIDADGEFVKEVKVRAVGETEWVKRYVDMLGRPYKTVFPVDATTTASTTAYFSPTTGQLVRQEEFGEVTTLFEYNPKGEVHRKAVDMNGNGTIDPSDRVEQVLTSYSTYEGKTVRHSESHVGMDAPLIEIPIQNSSFEAVSLAESVYENAVPTTWIGTSLGGLSPLCSALNPTDSLFPGTSPGSSTSNPIDGVNLLAIRNYSIHQDLNATLTSNTKYILRMMTGKSKVYIAPPWQSFSLSLRSADNGQGIASVFIPSGPPGNIFAWELSYTASSTDPFLGHRLSIWITALSNNDTSRRGFADKVQLFSQQVADNTRILASTERTSLDGRYTWTSSFGRTTSHAENCYPSERKRVVTDTALDSSKTIREYIDGRLQSVTRSDGNDVQLEKTSYLYYPNGLLWQEVDARNGATTYNYDTAENIATVTTPAPGLGQTAGQTTTIVTDYLNSQGRIETITQPDNSQIVREYYLAGGLKRSAGGQSPTVEYEYEQGRVTKLATWRDTGNPSTAQTTSFSYNAYRGFIENKFIDGTWSASYNYYNSGRLKNRFWNGGPTTTYSYNKAGELETVDHSDLSPDVHYVYNLKGQVTTVEDGTGSHNYTYNANQQLDEETHQGGILNGISSKHEYDTYLRPKDLTLKRSGSPLFTQSLSYHDKSSRLKSVSSGNHVVTYEYEPNSNLIKYERFKRDGEAGTPIITTTQTYDYLDRLRDASNSGGAADSRTVQYNQLNKREKITQQDGSYWFYQYDTHGRVKSGKNYWADGTPAAGQQFEYAFDDADNRVFTKAGGNGAGANLRSAQYTADIRNQYVTREVPGFVDIIGSANSEAKVTVDNVQSERKGAYFRVELPLGNETSPIFQYATVRGVRFDSSADRDVMTTDYRFATLMPRSETFQYDARGNLTQDGRWTYGWDADNRLVSMEHFNQSRVLFAYDYRGRRVEKTLQEFDGTEHQTVNVIRYVYEGWTPIAELVGLNNNSLRQFYVWGPDQGGRLSYSGGSGALKLLWDAASAQMYFVTLDAAGNVSKLVNATDNTISAAYDYGPFGESLVATGAMKWSCPFRYGCRYQDNESGLIYFGHRYYHPGLGRWLSRDPLGEAGGPNLYAFAGNDPVNLFDPLGLSWYEPGLETIEASGWLLGSATKSFFTEPPKAAYALTFGLPETAASLVGAVRAIPRVIDQIGSGKFKCLFGEKWEDFQRMPDWEQRRFIAENFGDFVGSVSTLEIGKLLKALEWTRFASRSRSGLGDLPHWVTYYETVGTHGDDLAALVANLERQGFMVRAGAQATIEGKMITYGPNTKKWELLEEFVHYRVQNGWQAEEIAALTKQLQKGVRTPTGWTRVSQPKYSAEEIIVKRFLLNNAQSLGPAERQLLMAQIQHLLRKGARHGY